MGRYNPNAPYILGEQWVGIRDEDIAFSAAANTAERGHAFTLAQTRILNNARFYIRDYPPGTAIGQTFLASIYPLGQQDQGGPVKSVIIPVSGTTLGGGATADTTGIADLSDPSDDRYITFDSTLLSFVDCAFATNSYSAQLSGKRIVQVNVLYAGYSNGDVSSVGTFMLLEDSTDSLNYGPLDGASYNGFPLVVKKSLGDINHFWSTTAPSLTNERLPWRFAGLQRFDPSSGSPVRVSFGTDGGDPDASNYYLGYAALEVFYTDETRVAYGGKIFGNYVGAAQYQLGMNQIPMRTFVGALTNPPLVAGDYLLTITSGDPGESAALFTFGFDVSTYPPMQAVRETQSLTGMGGVLVRIPKNVGQVIESETTHILPHLSMHTTGTGAPLINEGHVYGRIAAAPVYGSIIASQNIVDDLGGAVARSYPWVRYYARRFGDTSQPLVLSTSSPTISGSGFSITVAEFDALMEIVDGWKEVTGRFTVAPTMGTISGDPTWQWSSTLETVANRWEVLGVSAIAISGIPSNRQNLVPSNQRLDSGTYGTFGSGGSALLTWQSPTTTGTATADASSDAVVMFSTDMPTVTGVSVSEFSLPVTGIGAACSVSPSCIPTAILANRVTWSAIATSSIPASGFGYYELQRMDTEDTDWQTIMLLPTQSATSFIDYEARIGLLSSYRIRGINNFNFPGAWSATVSRTIAAPGVTGVSGAAGVLIFTTNVRQSGVNFVAYVQMHGTEVEEPIGFVESSWQSLQPMYDKNFLTAFRSSERGGEQFSRTLLVQKAATTGPLLDKAVVPLRDLAWNDVPYVCVRTEQSDRWFANVTVPNIMLRRYRQLQYVTVVVTEVSDTPYAVEAL